MKIEAVNHTVHNRLRPQAPAPKAKPIPAACLARDQVQLQSLQAGIPATIQGFGETTLPPIVIEKRDHFTYYRNAFGVQITQVDYPQGKYFYLLSSQGLGIMLRQHDDKRDTLNFSDMNFNITRPSQIPNVYFHVPGETASRIHFNARHEVVIDLSNGESLTLDAHAGENLLQGPLSIRFFPTEQGQNFDVVYCGSDTGIKRFKSKGDTIQW
ncbi:MAG: hypothetical protein CVV27_01395 [Candidatus Melainabacteria bacterium HGW-Melainabacteria-1]|nr:MAG: hypothetical protein CVV27_01395 [Candidatus Melainabacteria bacterium HGW-Melainabacteria-1]